MPSQHATLSPSASSRWISCPASIRMEELVPKDERDEESPYAREGTIAHELCEIEAGLSFGLIDGATYLERRGRWFAEEFSPMGYPDGTLADMEAHVEAYVDLLHERFARRPNSVILLEQRLFSGIEGCWGTSDAVIVSTSHVEIVDFKYGAGVPVSAEGNSQLRIYGLGALDTYGDLLGEAEEICMTVHQPRLGARSTETMTPDDLRAWREEIVRPAAEETAEPDARFGPSETACRWCPAAGLCRARVEAATMEDFGPVTDAKADPVEPRQPDLITAEEMGAVLDRLPQIKSWLTAVEAAALEMAYTRGEHIPGYKVVLSGGRRSINDGALAIQRLIDSGFQAEQVADFKPKGLGVLEKLVGGKADLENVIGDFIVKSRGKESLVPESDKRSAISPVTQAAEDFKEES